MSTKIDVVSDPTGVPVYTEIKLGPAFANSTREYVRCRDEMNKLKEEQKNFSTKILVLLGATGLTKTMVGKWIVHIIDPQKSGELNMEKLYMYLNVNFGITADQMATAVAASTDPGKKGKAFVTVTEIKKGKKEKIQ